MRKDTRRVPFAGGTLPILSPEHLAICKAMFDRTQDWIDLEQMLVAGDVDVPEVESWLVRMLGRRPPPAAAASPEGRGPGSLGGSGGLVGDDDHVVVLDPAGGDRGVAVRAAWRAARACPPGDQPEDLPGRGKLRVGEGHAAVALVVASGDRDAAVGRRRGPGRRGPARRCGRRGRGRGGPCRSARAARLRIRAPRHRGRGWVTGIGRRAAWRRSSRHADQVGEVALLAARRGDPLVDLEDARSHSHGISSGRRASRTCPGRAAAAHRQAEARRALDGRLRAGCRDQLGAPRATPPSASGSDLESIGPRSAQAASRRGRRTACASRRAPCRRSRRGRARRSARTAPSVRTGAGTPSSIAAIEVQRPSPESETRPREVREVGRFLQRRGGQVEQPGADHAAPPPDLGDLRDVEVVLVVLGMLERRRLGVGLALHLAGVGVVEDVQALGVGGHDAVLDPVVDHLHEVARRRSARSAGSRARRATGSPSRPGVRSAASTPGASEAKIGSSRSHRLVGPADHQAVAAVEAEDAAAGAAVDEVDALLAQLLGPADVVAVVGVAAVDDRVARARGRPRRRRRSSR